MGISYVTSNSSNSNNVFNVNNNGNSAWESPKCLMFNWLKMCIRDRFIGVCAYLLPALGYFNRRYYVAEKMKRCTKEIDATIIKVIKSLDDGEFPHSTIYIPIFQFYLDGKEHTFMDSKEIYSYKKFIVGSKVKLFVNPNGVKFDYPNGSDDIFFPISQNERNYIFVIFFGYVSTIIIFLIIILDKILN